MNTMSKVSILLPAYNRDRYMAAAIESVLSQTYQNWELLIADNCSQDKTFAIASKYANRDKRILCWKNETNIGPVRNYNKCIERASGEYIELFGADDIFEPTCLQKLVQALDENPSVVLVTAAKRHIDEKGQLIREDRPHSGSQLIPSEEAIRSNIVPLTNWIISPVMYRSKYKNSGFDLSLGNFGDLEYWTQILVHGNLFYIDEILFNYRIHAGSETTHTLNELDYIPPLLRIAERHAAHLASPGNPEAQPYKIVVEKLMNLVDYSTNFLKLDFDSLLGSLANPKESQGSLRDIDSQFKETGDLNDDLRDFKRVSYLALLHALDLRKELDWLYAEYNDLKHQFGDLSSNDRGENKAKEIAGSLLNKDSWFRHMRVLDEMRNENEALHHRIDELSKQLNTLLNSQSWRITAPLRMVRKKISTPEPSAHT